MYSIAIIDTTRHGYEKEKEGVYGSVWKGEML